MTVLIFTSLIAAELVLPSASLDRDRVVPVVFRMSNQVSGTGQFHLRWTDALGRTVEDRKSSVTLTDEAEFSFPLDLRRAVAMRNVLEAKFTVKGANLKGPDVREESATTTFVARPSVAKWTDYEITMWQQYPKALLPALREIGINNGQFSGRSETLPENFIGEDMRWYAENIGTDFYAEYHRYRRDRIQHWAFLQAKEMLKKNPDSKDAFKRNPSLSDPVWRQRVQDRLVQAARRLQPYRPLFYSLADESGIADLAAFWDFDFSDMSLVPMRRWLQSRYGSLSALNAEWETSFATWEAVTPPTTHEAMAKPGDNFAAWADFKEWMDVVFADALLMGRKAVESVDPEAYVNIGGGQRPGWGGYDYARITKALTAIEPYDIGNNVEIIRSLNPAMAMVSTGFASGPWEQQRVWRELFHGQRGLIIWDEKLEYVNKDGTPGERGIAAGKYYNELRNGIGSLIINSQPVNEPIAIHYSQASMRTEWLLARRPEGDKWVERLAKVERTDDEFLRLRESWCQLIEDQGMQYKFVSYDQLENGELLRGGYRVFILPRSSSLSRAEVKAIKEFQQQGGVVIADGAPGTFNEHSRRLAQSPLASISPISANTLSYHTDRLQSKEATTHKLVGDLLRRTVQPIIPVTGASGGPVVGVETHVFRNGGATIVTLLSNPLQRVDELGPPDFRSNQRFEKNIPVTVHLPAAMWLYDVRTGKALGQQKTFAVTVTPYEPVILAASPLPFPELRVSAPAVGARGSALNLGIASNGSPASTHVFHVELRNPQGKRTWYYSSNELATPDGSVMKTIPLAVNETPGQWTVHVHDILSGQRIERKVTVQ